MTSNKSTCEWIDGCDRAANEALTDGTPVCRGHRLLAAANYDAHGEYGISASDYRERLVEVTKWLQDNPA